MTSDDEYSPSEEDGSDGGYGDDDDTSDDDLLEPRKRASSTHGQSRSRPSTVSRKRPKEEEEEEEQGEDDSSLPEGVDPDWQPNVMEERAVLFGVCEEWTAGTNHEAVVEALVQHVEEERRAQAREELQCIVQEPVDQAAVKVALEAVNRDNKTLHQQHGGDRLHSRLQVHGGDVSSRHAVLGSFPVTSVLADGVDGANETLSNDANATNIVTNTLHGVGGGARARERAIVANQLPTTLECEYTAVPGQSDYQLFDPAFRRFLAALNKAGVRIFSCIAPSTADVVLSELAAAEGTSIITLRHHAEFKLLLVVPLDRPSFLLEVPFEHRSHLMWQALKYSNRLLLTAGCATTAAPVRALLGLPPLQPGALLALVGPEQKLGDGRGTGWYRSGAYCEAVMRQKLFAFMAAYGDELGRQRWYDWYTGCKRRGGSANYNYEGTGKTTAGGHSSTRDGKAAGGRDGGSAESTRTAGGHYGIIRAEDGKAIRFTCKLKRCGCVYEGTLFYNNGKNLSGRGTGVKHHGECKMAGSQVARSTTAAVQGPYAYEDSGELVGRHGSQQDFEEAYPKPPPKSKKCKQD